MLSHPSWPGQPSMTDLQADGRRKHVVFVASVVWSFVFVFLQSWAIICFVRGAEYAHITQRGGVLTFPGPVLERQT